MKRAVTIFIQIVIVLLGVGVVVALLWEPQLEGRNANATQFEIYFNDPFLAYIYVAFIPFFVGLYQLFTIAGNARRDELFSNRSLRALKIIKYCAIVMAIFFIGAVAYLFVFIRGTDDIAGGVAIGGFFILSCVVAAVLATVLERTMRNSIETKSENKPNS